MVQHLQSGDQTMAPEDSAWQAMPHLRNWMYLVYNFIMISASNTRTVHSSSVQNYSFQELRGVDSDRNNSEGTEEFCPQIQDGGMTKQVEGESTMALKLMS